MELTDIVKVQLTHSGVNLLNSRIQLALSVINRDIDDEDNLYFDEDEWYEAPLFKIIEKESGKIIVANMLI